MDFFEYFNIKYLLGNNTIFVAVGVVLAGIIGATISLIGLIFSKETKIAEFRQEWINGFREDLAKVVFSLDAIATLLYEEKIKKQKEIAFHKSWLGNDKNTDININSSDDSSKVEKLPLISLLYRIYIKKLKILFDTTPVSTEEMQALFCKNKKLYKSFLKSYEKNKLWLQEDSGYCRDIDKLLNNIYY